MDIKRSHEINHQYPGGKTEEDYAYSKSAKIFHTDQLFLYSEQVLPGRKTSIPHFHNAIDEIILISEGELTAFEGDESTVLKQGDSVCFKAKSGKLHYLQNNSKERAEYLIFRRNIKRDDIVLMPIKNEILYSSTSEGRND